MLAPCPATNPSERDRGDRAVFGVIAPALPARHGFVVVAGVATALTIMEVRSFAGDVWAMPEGTLAFADEPLFELSGPPVETERLAHAIADTLSIQTATATSAARMKLAGGGRPVVDATSRTHADDGARQRARAAVIGGATHTTNLWAASRYGVAAIDTQAPTDAFPNVRGALVTADDLDELAIRDLVRNHAPVTACAFGARIPDVALRVERWEHEPVRSAAGPGPVRPCAVQVYRLPAANGDVVAPREDPPVAFARPLLTHVMAFGRRLGPRSTVAAARARCAEALAVLAAEVADLERPEAVRVTWSDEVWRSDAGSPADRPVVVHLT
jgi:hypothetical protein